MEITLYKNFSKQINSTKRPSTTTAHEVRDVKLKAPTTLTAPTFLIRGVDLSVNYIKWASRYYFVNEIVLGNNEQYEIVCSLDVMATWKTNILNSTQYVLRSASKYDPNIEDNAYIAKANKEFISTDLLTGNFRFGGTSVCMGVIGKGTDTNTLGAVSYYLMSIDTCRQLLNVLMSENPEYLNIDSSTMEVGLQKALINPIQYIVTCELVPIDYTAWGNAHGNDHVNKIPVGWWEMSVTDACRLVYNALHAEYNVWTKQISLPTHPNYSERGLYLNYNNWSHHSLYIEPYGIIPIDRNALKNNEIKITERFDIISGMGTLTVDNEPVTGASGRKVVYKNAKLSIPIQMSQSGVDKLAQAQISNAILQNEFNYDMTVQKGKISMASGATKVVSGIATGNVSNALGGAFEMLNSAVDTNTKLGNLNFDKTSLMIDARRASFPITEKSGVNGALMAWYVKPLLLSSFDIPVDDDNVHLGRPLCEDVQLSTLSGYTQTREASINLPSTIQETEMVKGIMNGGFYIE